MTRRRLTDEERVASRERSNALTRARMERYRGRLTEARRAAALAKLEKCKYIYRPKGQAEEYSPLAANPYHGCGHRYLYCYVPGVFRISRAEFDEAANPREDFLKELWKDATKYEAVGVTDQ